MLSSPCWRPIIAQMRAPRSRTTARPYPSALLVALPGDQHLTRLLTPGEPKALGARRKQLGEVLFNELAGAPLVLLRQPLPLQRQLCSVFRRLRQPGSQRPALYLG